MFKVLSTILAPFPRVQAPEVHLLRGQMHCTASRGQNDTTHELQGYHPNPIRRVPPFPGCRHSVMVSAAHILEPGIYGHPVSLGHVRLTRSADHGRCRRPAALRARHVTAEVQPSSPRTACPCPRRRRTTRRTPAHRRTLTRGRGTPARRKRSVSGQSGARRRCMHGGVGGQDRNARLRMGGMRVSVVLARPAVQRRQAGPDLSAGRS